MWVWSYLKEEGVFGKTLEWLQQEGGEQGGGFDHLAHLVGPASLLELVEFAHCRLLALFLVRDIWLVDLECIFVEDKKIAPILFFGGLCVCLLDADEEAALEVKEGVEVEEDVVHEVSADDALFFHQLFEFLEELEMLDVGALRLD